MRSRHAGGLVILACAFGARQAEAQQFDRIPSICAECHTDVDPGRLDVLTHSGHLSCMSCHHVGFTNDPEEARARRVDACLACHEDLRESHVDAETDAPDCAACHGIHEDPPLAQAAPVLSARCSTCHAAVEHDLHAAVETGAPVCTECHTSHTGGPPRPDDGALNTACGSCHEDAHPTHVELAESFSCAECHTVGGPPVDVGASPDSDACARCHVDLIPSHGTVDDGAPSCTECHDFGEDAPVLSVGPEMSRTCGACHEDAMAGFMSGAHAQGLGAEPNVDLPTCVSCHRSHMDPGEERAYLRFAATMRCVECHSQELLADRYDLSVDVAPTYEADFHGATARFLWNHPAREGQPPVMVCSDCHGAHDVGWNENDLVADVCRECHEGSDDRLASAWIGHEAVGPGNRPMVWLVRIFYVFLIPFMLGGLFLHIVFNLVDERRKGARVLKSEGVQRLLARIRGRTGTEEETVRRFSSVDRWEHLVSMVTFVLLVVTGLPQTRPDLAAANVVIVLFGGIAMTRIVHRVAGFLFVALMVTHVARAVIRAIRRRHLPIMVPVKKDFFDVLQTLRHYFLREPKPRVGKFDHSEKFEYWGLFLGAIVMGASGMVLVFPEVVTMLVPGEVVAAMRTMHGLEATFAVMVVALWHSYGVVLRPEIFPLDTTIFSGKMSVARLEHEHPLEYERLFPERVRAEKGVRGVGGDSTAIPGAEQDSEVEEDSVVGT